jgi:hypothetical protein
MNTRITIIIRNLALAAAMVFAHGGLEHVQGTVTQVGDHSVMVKTTVGKTVEVTLDAKTTYSRASKPVQKSDLKAGDRVVIHAAEQGKALVAQTVEMGTAAVAKTTPAQSSATQH